MTRSGAISELEPILQSLEPPVLVLSTRVGRGTISLGEAILERLPPSALAVRVSIEDYLPAEINREDVGHYRWISTHCPLLLNLVYRIPLIYRRKYWKAKRLPPPDLRALENLIRQRGARTVVCLSHRPTFWCSVLKETSHADFGLWCVSVEYGMNLGYRYLFWEHIDGFLSPIPPERMSISFPPHTAVHPIELPVRQAFHDLRHAPADRNSVLLTCGYWGQGPLLAMTRMLLKLEPRLRVHVACGENEHARAAIEEAFGRASPVNAYGPLESIHDLLRLCGSVITKPGLSTILESQAAGRKLFLLKGMPVAEDHNAEYALRHFGAEWFSPRRFKTWMRPAAEHIP